MTDHTPRAESSAIDGSPVWLWLDPTTRCNLACRLCYTKLSHGKDDMTPKDLRRMLCDLRDSASVDVQTIHLNWRGEPLMNPRFAELLATVGEVMPTIPLQWHTNGTMLTEKRVEEIVSVDFDHKIFVSLDGGNRLSHDLNRGEGNFEKSLRGLEILLDRARDRPGLRVGSTLDVTNKSARLMPESRIASPTSSKSRYTSAASIARKPRCSEELTRPFTLPGVGARFNRRRPLCFFGTPPVPIESIGIKWPEDKRSCGT